MIVKQELINKIRDYFCLNIYETKVWLALLGKGVASAGEIAEISRVPRSRTYDVLEGLEKRGFVIMKLGKPVKYIAVKPNIILDKLKQNAMKDAEEKMQVLSKLKDSSEYSELEELYNTGIQPVKHEDISGAIKGKSIIYGHIKEILENAHNEVMICTSASEINMKPRFFESVFNKLRDSGLNVKIALSGDDKEIKRINTKFKINAKKIDIDARFFIADGEQVLFLISKGSPDEEVAVWINTPFFTSSLSFMFNEALRK